MMKRCFSLFISLWLLSCNKVIQEVELPPFTAYPNPFIDQVGFYFDPNRFQNAPVFFRISDGKKNNLLTTETTTNGPLILNLSDYEEGIYYVEMEIAGQTFNSTILKAK